MKELDQYRNRKRAAREDQAKAKKHRAGLQNSLRRKQKELAGAQRRGKGGKDAQLGLQKEIEALQAQIDVQKSSVQELPNVGGPTTEATTGTLQPWELVEGWKDSFPCFLLPVRIEARFMTVEDRHELWVRIFPDDIAIHTHEDELTSKEFEAGKTFWKEKLESRNQGDLNIEKGAWRVLAVSYGGPRAAWIKDQTRPTNFDTAATANVLHFPDPPGGILKLESWSQAPEARVMPDQFVVMGFIGGAQMFRQAGNPIQHPLTVGPNPSAEAKDEFLQEAGELQVGKNIAWIYDFEQAVEIGMGMKIVLNTDIAQVGLDQLLVLGLRLSDDEKESQALVEDLLENHIYSLKGMSFVPQGTPTNNTERQGSGFTSADPGAERSFALETKPPLQPVNDHVEKQDGQRFVEALGLDFTGPVDSQNPSNTEELGLDHTALKRVEFADRNDMQDALHMSRALWSGTLGYYLEEMAELEPATIEKIRTFFMSHIAGRGLLPAIRIGSQPYGMLLTSDFSHWSWSSEQDSALLPELDKLYSLLREMQNKLPLKTPIAAQAGQADSQDAFESLLDTLGLQASSVEFYRRYAVARQYLWNSLIFRQGPLPHGTDIHSTQERERLLTERRKMIDNLNAKASTLSGEAGISTEQIRNIFRLVFFDRQDAILDPIVDDIPAAEQEKLSETQQVRAYYPDPRPSGSAKINYIDWLGHSSYSDIRNQNFANAVPDAEPFPRPLLYRMLRTSLLQALYDAALGMNSQEGTVGNQETGSLELPLAPIDHLKVLRPDLEMVNIQEKPKPGEPVTRWDFLNEDISNVLDGQEPGTTVGDFLLSDPGLQRAESIHLRETVESIRVLAHLSTAQLERVFTEYLDVCSYRLDAWQTGFFSWRLLQQRFPPVVDPATPPQNINSYKKPEQGIYLGAFGWLEDLRPAEPLVPADLSSVPTSLHDPTRDGDLYEQPENKGFIHGPSINHAITAAILRSAYLNHFDPAHPEAMAVNLSSERVRIALTLLDGVRNGQELGALLGYQFERNLADLYPGLALSQYFNDFRKKYPVMADKIPPEVTATSQPSETTEVKEARNVFDGYALLDAVYHREPPANNAIYPYGVDNLPASGSPGAKAIECEVAGMAESLDAVADLCLAEGVYQATQGNFERAGAMLKVMTQGESPPEPEIVRTPRSGITITQRVALHLPIDGNAERWPGRATARAEFEPGLNAWLGDLLPDVNRIVYSVSLAGGKSNEDDLSRLIIQPIDLIYMIGDDLNGETTELESRIASFFRIKANNDALDVKIDFKAKPKKPRSINLFALLPLLRALRRIVTSSRPLSDLDYQLPSVANTNPKEKPLPQGVDLDKLEKRIQKVLEDFVDAVKNLNSKIPPNDSSGKPDSHLANAADLRTALRKLAEYGVPDAIPHSAFGAADQAKSILTLQAVNISQIVAKKRKDATDAKTAGDKATSEAEKIAHYRTAAQAIFDPSFNFIPAFDFSNQDELDAAAEFRDADPSHGLTRFHQDDPFLVDEWIEGAARVQPGLNTMETVMLLSENLVKASLDCKPIQLPFRSGDHWMSVDYPEAFQPEGDYVSILQILPQQEFKPQRLQSGLVIDEWVEIIPSKSEVTGISFHFNQPNSEPPQVCLLAVTPEITGVWTWEKLVAILQDTLARAKQRAVEPDDLGDLVYSQLLPALISPIASHRNITITTDYVHYTARKYETLENKS
jgi:hypothetical protein